MDIRSVALVSASVSAPPLHDDFSIIVARAPKISASYTFKRNADNSDFETTNGQPLRVDGSNAIPYILPQEKGTELPSIGFISEF